jgi:hypothetical protein
VTPIGRMMSEDSGVLDLDQNVAACRLQHRLSDDRPISTGRGKRRVTLPNSSASAPPAARASSAWNGNGSHGPRPEKPKSDKTGTSDKNRHCDPVFRDPRHPSDGTAIGIG